MERRRQYYDFESGDRLPSAANRAVRFAFSIVGALCLAAVSYWLGYAHGNSNGQEAAAVVLKKELPKTSPSLGAEGSESPHGESAIQYGDPGRPKAANAK